jgi:hypothetical protein
MSVRRLATRRAAVVGTVALALALGSTTVGLAAGARSPQAGGTVAHSALVPAAVTPVSCNGGNLKFADTIGSNTPQVLSGSTLQNLSTTPLTFSGPATGKDTVMVTWTGETQLRGNTDGAQFDWVEGAIILDGNPITDVGPDQLALTGSSEYSSNGVQACVKVGPGKHTLNVQAAVITNGSSTAESAWIDDWVLRADVLN